ncbi:MAG TPA: hypothetical protein VHM19_08220 [Polyangiales bacterium]|nr:hypothetical protein [Polyangiales bacterium]
MSRDDTPIADRELLPPLDDAPGPADVLGPAEADAVAWSVVSRFVQAVPGMEPADSDPGPAPELDAAQAERMAKLVARKHKRSGVLGMIPWRSAAAVALVCMFGGVAFAAVRTWVERAHEREVSVAREAARLAKGKRLHVKLATPSSLPAPALLPPPAALPQEPVAAPVVTPAPVVAPSPSPAQHRAAPSPAPTQGDSAAELLARANALRAQQAWRGAEQLYLRVLSSRADTQERYAAAVAAASLAVSHTGAPRRGLTLYRRALEIAPSGDLAEEARWGLAEAYRALGDHRAEAAALRDFMQRYPRSVSSARARDRLTALDLGG